MTLTIIRTDRDIRDYVVEALGHYVKDHDVEAITRQLIAEFNVTGPDPADDLYSIPHDHFWTIVEQNAADK